MEAVREDCLSPHPPAALPWLNVSADGEDVRLVLDVSEEQRFGLSLYWNQDQGPIKPWWHSNLVRPPPPQVHSHAKVTSALSQGTLEKDTATHGQSKDHRWGNSCLPSVLNFGLQPSSYSSYPASPLLLVPQTGPQTITLNHTDLVPCLCIQVGAESGWGPREGNQGIGERVSLHLPGGIYGS